MAYSATNLTQLAHGAGFKLWVYKSADAIATVNTSGYFNDASDVLKVGDLIYVHDSNTPTGSLCIVLSNASGVVDVSDGTTIAVTDTD